MITLVLWILVEIAIREYLFDATLPIINYIRSNLATKHSDLLFRIISELGDKPFVAVLIILAYMMMDVPKGFCQALLSFTSLVTITILKTMIHEARPFMTHTVSPAICPLEYGNPSGHSMISSSVFFTFCELGCRHMGWIGSNEILKRRIFQFLTAIGVLVVSFSRIWLGVHTLNQILNGWVWGFSLQLLFTDILYYEICRFVHSIYKRSPGRLVYNFGTRNYVFIFFLGSAIFYFSFILHPTPKEWVNKLNENCGT